MYIDRLIDAIYTIRPLIQIVHGPKCPSDFSWTLSATLMTLVTTAEWATPYGAFLDILGDGTMVETGETWPLAPRGRGSLSSATLCLLYYSRE